MEEKNIERDRAAKDTYDDYAGTFPTLRTSEGDSTLELKGVRRLNLMDKLTRVLTTLAMAPRARDGCRETTFTLPGLREEA